MQPLLSWVYLKMTYALKSGSLLVLGVPYTPFVGFLPEFLWVPRKLGHAVPLAIPPALAGVGVGAPFAAWHQCLHVWHPWLPRPPQGNASPTGSCFVYQTWLNHLLWCFSARNDLAEIMNNSGTIPDSPPRIVHCSLIHQGLVHWITGLANVWSWSCDPMFCPLIPDPHVCWLTVSAISHYIPWYPHQWSLKNSSPWWWKFGESLTFSLF